MPLRKDEAQQFMPPRLRIRSASVHSGVQSYHELWQARVWREVLRWGTGRYGKVEAEEEAKATWNCLERRRRIRVTAYLHKSLRKDIEVRLSHMQYALPPWPLRYLLGSQLRGTHLPLRPHIHTPTSPLRYEAATMSPPVHPAQGLRPSGSSAQLPRR